MDKYEYWKSCIENGNFIFINDDEYDEFTKIHEKEVKKQDFLAIQQEDIVENEVHIEEFTDHYDILEDKPTVPILAYFSWIMSICIIFGITMSNTTFFSQEDIDSFSDVTKIHEKCDEFYEFHDFNWLIF